MITFSLVIRMKTIPSIKCAILDMFTLAASTWPNKETGLEDWGEFWLMKQ